MIFVVLHTMLSRREKLLIRPWQQRRFETHRRKVSSALPAIDNKPPASYNHVSLKLKKQQREKERLGKIERDNLTLLRKLNRIMKTSRVDNFWISPPPDFLSRETIYESNKMKGTDQPSVDIPLVLNPSKSRCSACSANYSPPKPIIPEERVPWSPMKPPVGKHRSQSVPLPKVSSTIDNEIKDTKEGKSQISKSSKEKSKSAGYRTNNIKKLPDFCQRLTLCRGDLKLVVNFPVDTTVTFHDTFSKKLISNRLCSCKAMKSK